MKLLHAILNTAVIMFVAVTCASNGVTQQMVDAATIKHARIPFAVIYRAGPTWRPGMPMEKQDLRDHFYYLHALHKENRIIAAGPLGEEGGLVLLFARDQAEADSVIAADPAVVAGLFAGDAKRFIPRFVGKELLSTVAP